MMTPLPTRRSALLVCLSTVDARPRLISFARFARDNADAFDVAEIAEMRARLDRGDVVTIGGGAAPLHTLRRAVVRIVPGVSARLVPVEFAKAGR